MILTNDGLSTLGSINEAWLREALQLEASLMNDNTDTHMDVYNSRPNHFTIIVDDAFEYMLDTTDYTAELTQHVPTFQDETLLVAVVDDSDTFEDELAIMVISTVYKTL